MLGRLHLRESFSKMLLQLLSLALSGSDDPTAPLSSGGRGESCIAHHQSESQAAQAHFGLLCGWTSSTQRYWAPPPSSFIICFLFSYLCLTFCCFCAIHHCYFPVFYIRCPTIPPFPHLIYRGQWKQAVIRSANSPAPLWPCSDLALACVLGEPAHKWWALSTGVTHLRCMEDALRSDCSDRPHSEPYSFSSVCAYVFWATLKDRLLN